MRILIPKVNDRKKPSILVRQLFPAENGTYTVSPSATAAVYSNGIFLFFLFII